MAASAALLAFAAGGAVALVTGLAKGSPFGLGSSSAHASARPSTPAQRRANLRYLEAEDAFDRAWVIREPEAVAALHALARRLEGECAGVADDAPTPASSAPAWSDYVPLSGAKSSGRRLRLSEMQAEVGTAVVAVALAPSRRAAEQFVHAGESDLRAEDGDAPVQRFNLGSLSHLLRSAAVPDVCADARAWRSSRFRHVSPFTARLGVRFKSQSAKFAAAVRDPGIESSSFTDAAERALYQKIDHLSEPRRRVEGAAEARIDEALGLASRAEAESVEDRRGTPKGSVVLRRPTAAGHRSR